MTNDKRCGIINIEERYHIFLLHKINDKEER
nr:MAG TPA: hypothetical protein [Caudoviricetes sp.]